jgi:DNA-binding transcriptional ArsR family regulator
MPLHNAPEYDSIAALMRFRSSAVFEMLVGLQESANSWQMKSFTDEVRLALGNDFVDDLAAFYRDFHTCCAFAELAADFEDHDDLNGFFEYVEKMPEREFTFYTLGRYFPVEELPEKITEEKVTGLFESHGESELLFQTYPKLDWANDVPGLKRNLVKYWRTYWEGFFSKKIPELRDMWVHSIKEKRAFLENNGGTELLKHLSGYDELPEPLPADQPFTAVEIIPLFHTSHQKIMYYGYGKVNLLYDCKRTEEHESEIENSRDRSLEVMRALSDENRLKILKLIAKKERFLNGKGIAKELDLSPSVVSRHLSQLKDSGLIEEYSPDKRNITYSFNLERLKSLGHDIEAYLRD